MKGISSVYNKTEEGRENRQKAIRRNKDNRRKIGEWHKEVKANLNKPTPFPAVKSISGGRE